MTLDEMVKIFVEEDDEFLKFDRIAPERRLSNRPDLNAFLLLDKLMPGERDMVCSAEHDQIWLDTACEVVAGVATEEDILDLMRSGVMYNKETDSFSMFV